MKVKRSFVFELNLIKNKKCSRYIRKKIILKLDKCFSLSPQSLFTTQVCEHKKKKKYDNNNIRYIIIIIIIPCG